MVRNSSQSRLFRSQTYVVDVSVLINAFLHLSLLAEGKPIFPVPAQVGQ
jgi:hypothetical protein